VGRVNTRKAGFFRLRRTGLVLALAAAATLAASATGAAAASSGTTDVITQPVVGETWAGYDSIAATTPASAANTYFTSVTGSFAAPALRCDSGDPARASVWVGLGGVLTTRAVYGPLQVGIDADCHHGRASYSAWYEAYPEPLQPVHLPVAAGDSLTATVSIDAGGRPHVALRDLTTGHAVAKSLAGIRVKPLATDSAEWIVEGPARGESLADFGSVTFTNATATESATAAAHTGPVDDPAWDYSEPDVIALQDSGVHQSDVAASAAPGPLDPAGDSFTVSYGAGAPVSH
jgi:hypothetical protein